MANIVKNRIVLRGSQKQVNDIFLKYNTEIPETVCLNLSGDIICIDKNTKELVGWYDEKNNTFKYESTKKL